jgi:hypothetical protein
MTEAEFTPAWVSNVLDTEVKSFQTHLCGQLGCRAHALLCVAATTRVPALSTEGRKA